MLQGFMAVVVAKQQVAINTLKNKANSSSTDKKQIGFIIDETDELSEDDENENF